MISADAIVELVAAADSSPFLFNHYAQAIPGVDLPSAPQIRRENLAKYLSAHQLIGSSELWVLEAPSKRGALRTGVPLTSESKLVELSKKLGVSPPFARATNGAADFAAVSQTSQAVWEAIGDGKMPVLWNAIMLRPHTGDLTHTRNPSRDELRKHAPILVTLVDWLKPKSIVWVGRKAERIADYAKLVGKTVRHPANGGKSDFLHGILTIQRANSRA